MDGGHFLARTEGLRRETCTIEAEFIDGSTWQVTSGCDPYHRTDAR